MNSKKRYYSSLEEIYLKNYRLVNVFIGDCLNDAEMKEDVASIVWMKVAERPESFLEMDEYLLKNYLRVMVRNVIFDEVKAEDRNKRLYEKLKNAEMTNQGENEVDFIAFAVKKEDYLRESVKILSYDEKLIIHMKYVRKLSSKEIGDIFEISDGAVRMRQSRITVKLKAEIIRLMKEKGDWGV